MIDLPALKALCDAATPGPWMDAATKPSGCGGWDSPADRTIPKAPTGSLIQSAQHTSEEAVIMASRYDNSPWCLPEDRTFIAAARQALPELIAEVGRLRTTLEWVRNEAETLPQAQAMAREQLAEWV